MPSRPFRVGRSATGLGLFATKPIKRAAYIATYRGPANIDRRSRPTLGTGRELYFRVEQPMEYRRLAATERGPIHQSFLPL
jgi:hypothetical protein